MPSKGVRVQITARLPVDTHRRAVIEARRRGWTLNDLLVAALDSGQYGEPPPKIVRQNLQVYDTDGNVIGRL